MPRLEVGSSDPVAYTCTCPAKETGDGVVLLFYRYFANSPPLLEPTLSPHRVQELAIWQEQLTARLAITGKLRIASEGFNVTVGGCRDNIQDYISACIDHWSFQGLQLSTIEQLKAFFKPSLGCACVFLPATTASVKICSEITPLGITNYRPKNWDIVEELPPAEFHRRCLEEDICLMDLRNHYESRIGHFVSPTTGEAALRPQIRRFSQWPRFIKNQVLPPNAPKQVLTYCTGGIRCEKATRWMAERGDEKRRICTLKGGIAAYLDWIREETTCGRMIPEDSLFKGKNYVFDARGALGLTEGGQAIAQCHSCGRPEDRLSKCGSLGCHLVLIICQSCEANDPRCCESCRNLSMQISNNLREGNRGLCNCEMAREAALWSTESPKPARSQGWRRKARDKNTTDIPIESIP